MSSDSEPGDRVVLAFLSSGDFRRLSSELSELPFLSFLLM